MVRSGMVTHPMARTDRLTRQEWKTVDAFHRLAYQRSCRWLGYPIIKTPIDLWIYQEILTLTRPQTIIECGTGGGGSALFFASILDLLGGGQVLTIDDWTDLQAFYAWAFP